MTRALIEDGLQLCVHRMVAKAIAGGSTQFSGVWSWTRDGERLAAIGFAVSLLPDGRAALRLDYRFNEEPVSYEIALISEACRFGGQRWFALCPRTGRKAAKLYKPPGAKLFLARGAWRLAYRSQRTAKGLARALDRRDRILWTKLKSDDPCIPIKPKWMRWKTYHRWMDALDAAERTFDRQFAIRFADRI